MKKERPGVQDRFEEFYRTHYERLVRAATVWTGDRYAAEDVSQDVMLTLRRYFDRYDRPEILMFRMARQHLGRGGARGGPAPARHSLVEAEKIADTAIVASQICDVEERLDLMSLVRRLPRRQQEVVVLTVVCDVSVRDTAQILGISESGVKTHKKRGLQALEAYLSGAEMVSAAEPTETTVGGVSES